MKPSIVIPFYNEAAIIPRVLSELHSVCGDCYEYILVDDGSTDATATILKSFSWATVIRLKKNMGQSAALYAGITAAKGNFIVTLDGDGQNDPRDIEMLLNKLADVDFVIGYRRSRKDSAAKRAASRLANYVRRTLLHDGVLDSGCGIKAFRKSVVKAFFPFNGLHRFMPALAINAGFRIAECAVSHRPRKGGISKYTNFERGLRGAQDLLGVSWMLRRAVYPTVQPGATHE